MATTLAAGILAAVAATDSPAAAVYGSAEIKPIESDIAEKFWASATDKRASADAPLAIDGDEATAWTAPGHLPGEWLAVDLGGAYDNLRKVEVVLAKSAYRSNYVIEASGDNVTWDEIAEYGDGRDGAAGATALMVRPDTRYVRVRSTSGSSAAARFGVAEISVFNYLRDDVVLGADISWADQDRNRAFYVDAETALSSGDDPGPHIFDVVQDRGMDYVRLRVWNEPRSEGSGNVSTPAYQGPERTLQVAKEVKERGLELGIDFHYADSWADPSKQPKPRAWAELPFPQLEQAVYDFTADYLEQLVAQGTVPDKVAVGNEVINGFMYGTEASIIGTTNPAYFRNQAHIYQSQPGGGLLWDYWNSPDPAERQQYDEAWDRFTTLMAAGIRAVRDASPTSKVEIHTIVDKDKLATTMEFWEQTLTRLNEKGVDPDVLATSYYPQYHGSPEALEENLWTIHNAFSGYPIEVAETSYPASGGGGSPMPNSHFPRTIQGQADALQRVLQIINDNPDNSGVGMLVWEPGRWQSLFTTVNVAGQNVSEANASIDVFNKSRAEHVLQDRMHLVQKSGRDVELPEMVQVLHSDGDEFERVAVEWGAVPADAHEGSFDVVGQTEFGAVTATVHVVSCQGRGCVDD